MDSLPALLDFWNFRQRLDVEVLEQTHWPAGFGHADLDVLLAEDFYKNHCRCKHIGRPLLCRSSPEQVLSPCPGSLGCKHIPIGYPFISPVIRF